MIHPLLNQGMRALVGVATSNGLHPVITSTYRSRTTQARLYRAWLARGKTGLPAAPPGYSKHELGLAFDMVAGGWPADDSALRALGALWESWGGRWGGRFNDPVHFEIS